MKQSRLASGRIIVKNPGEVSQDRYQFLDLASAEPNLGTASNGSILTTTVSGQRVFTTNISISNATLSGNLIANAVYTENLFYANGQPFVTVSGGGPQVTTNIYNGRVTATNAQTLIDSVNLTGVTSVKWVLSANDTVNDAYKTSTIDSSNDSVNIYYNEFSIVLSNPNIEVASYYAEIDGSLIKLYATGTSISVPITFQRTTLGSSTTVGNVQGIAFAETTLGSGTATVVNVDNFVGTGNNSVFTLTATPSAKNQTLIAIGGIVQPKSSYSLSGNVITFSSAPPTGAPVEIQTFVTTTVTGYTGSRGADGTVGYNGSVGYTGSKGLDGGLGALGYTGSIGPIGYTGSMGVLTNWTKKTSTYTAVNGDRIIADTTAGSFTINLPATPSLGSFVKITDGANFGINALTVGANGSTIEAQANDVLVDIGKIDLEFIYDGTTWQIISTMGPQGYTGSVGSLGYTGSQGAGYTGSFGYTGSIGYTGSVGASLVYASVNTNTTAVANTKYIVDTGAGNVVITLPSTPSFGQEIGVIDGTGNAGTNPITVFGNGSKIQGDTGNLTVSTSRAAFSLVYYNSAQGWILTNV